MTFTDGSSSGDVHSAGRAEVYGPIRCAWHKTQANEGEPALMTAVQRCVTGAGVALSGREDNPADLLAAVPENRQQILRDCVRTSLASIYPKLFSTSFP